SAAAIPERDSASRTTTVPRSTAERSLSDPPNDPIAVRHALRMTHSKSLSKAPYAVWNEQSRSRLAADVFDRRAVRHLAQHEPFAADLDDGKLRHDQVDRAGTRQR